MVTADEEEQWEAKKRDLLHMFGSILKSSPLSRDLESQTTLVALDQVLSMAPIGGPVDLTPFDAFVQERVSGNADTNQAMVFFEHRAAKIGVTLLLPMRIRDMDDDEKEGVLSDWTGAASQAVTYALKDQPPEQTQSSPRPKAKGYGKKKERRGPHPIFIVLMVLSIVGVGASTYYQDTTEGPRTRTDVTLPDDSAALKCVQTLAVKARLTCKVSNAAWSKYSKAEQAVRIEETKRLAETKGFNKLLVIVMETGQFIGSF